MKKILAALLLFIIPSSIFALTPAKEYYTNSNGVRMTQEEVENLKSMAFTDVEIETMAQEEFNQNKNLKGFVVAQDTKYIETTYYTLPTVSTFKTTEPQVYVLNRELTEDEYNSYNANQSSISTFSNPATYETNAKKLTTTIVKNGTRYRLKNNLQWKTMPKTRSRDVFGILQDSTVSGVPETRSATISYRRKNNCTGAETGWLSDTVYSATKNPANWKMTPSGYGVSMNLPEKDGTCSTADGKGGVLYGKIQLIGLEASMYYDIQKLQITTIQTINAYGSYQHATVSVDLAPSLDFGINSSGLGGVLNFSVNVKKKYDGMGGTHAYITGLSW